MNTHTEDWTKFCRRAVTASCYRNCCHIVFWIPMGNNSTEDWIKFCRRAVAGTLVASCYWLSYCYRWEMTTERIGTNFAGQAAPQSSPLLVVWNQRIRRSAYTRIGPNFAGELLSQLLSYRFLDTDVKSQQRGLDQSLPASCSRNFGSLMLLAFFATERIGPNFAGELYPQLW